MKLLLGSNECFVCLIVKLDVSKNGAYDERSDLFDGWINGDGQLWCSQFEFWCFDLLQIDFEGSDKSGLGQEVGSVVHTVEFVVGDLS